MKVQWVVGCVPGAWASFTFMWEGGTVMVAVTGRGVGDIPQVRVLSSGSSILWVTFSVTLVGGSGGAIHKVKTIKNGIPEAFLIIKLCHHSVLVTLDLDSLWVSSWEWITSIHCQKKLIENGLKLSLPKMNVLTNIKEIKADFINDTESEAHL
jgi:hypothetical protein